MSSDGRPRIVITKEDLRDPKIDEQISVQRSTGPSALQPVEENTRTQIFYSAWFYLLIAGTCGALLGWALIEPYIEDGILLTGRVQQVDAENLLPNFRRIVVSGVPVLVSASTTIRGGPGKQILYAVDDLRVDSVIKILGTPLKEAEGLAAFAIMVLPPDTPAPSQLDASALKENFSRAAFAIFPVVGGMIGLLVGCAEGLICRTIGRAVRCGLYGLVAGVIGGCVSAFAADIAYGSIGTLVQEPFANTFSFLIQMFRRGIAWCVVGMAMGLGQGWALKSGRLLFNGFIGGLVGGLVGGLLFDPIYIVFTDPSFLEGGALSRAVGLAVIGAAVGLMIGFTDMLTRTAWLRVTAGALRGKQFTFVQTPIRLGSSPKNEIYLFKDPKIQPVHAQIKKLRDTYELVDCESSTGTIVNGQRIKQKRLMDGDRIQIGDSEFVYTTRAQRATAILET